MIIHSSSSVPSFGVSSAASNSERVGDEVGEGVGQKFRSMSLVSSRERFSKVVNTS